MYVEYSLRGIQSEKNELEDKVRQLKSSIDKLTLECENWTSQVESWKQKYDALEKVNSEVYQISFVDGLVEEAGNDHRVLAGRYHKIVD